MKNQVSLCMIVKDEEEYLPRCLKSVSDIVQEIIIVDTGSKDKTVDIAKSFGAKVYFHKWNNNFSEARNESLKYAKRDWILILDADDELYTEDRENLKKLLNSELDDKAIYYFETLSYYGSSIQKREIAINLNPRLFRNNRGIHYKGEVHNQLVFSNGEYNAICNDIQIHHYGYLDKRIEEKNKRNRNIAILKNQINNNESNGFTYFNLGNEYTCLDDMKSALEWYYKSYEDFEPKRGYSFILLLRIIISNYNLGDYTEALKFIEIGIEHYPKCTDFYFYKALIWKALNRPTLQIKALEKCIELGEPPSELKFLYGTGTFKAYYELGNVYMTYEDYEAAYDNYIEAMKSKPDFIEPLYSIVNILKKQNVCLDDCKNIIEGFFPEDKKAYYGLIADLFYDIEEYAAALEYIKKSEASGIITDNILLLKSKALIRTGKFEESIKLNSIKEDSDYYVVISMYKILSAILVDDNVHAILIRNSIKEDKLSSSDNKYLQVYSELIKLFSKEESSVLSKAENEIEYMNIIFEILEIILVNEKFQQFDIAVKLLNLVDNKYALMNLGKLYHKHGYDDLAKKEILRSIKEFEVYDVQALKLLMV